MEDVRNFGTSIKKKYRERRINCEKQWPPCHSNKLVRLEIIEREKGEGYSAKTRRGRKDKGVKRSPIPYGDLFKEESGKRPVRKVLIEGDAGIGKTILCIAVSEGWANGELFQQFELVLLLPLRMKVVASAGSLPELLKLLHSSPRLCDSVARYLEEEEGESVLIIADGWDELSEPERKEGSFLFRLFYEEFPLVSVVLTSRPSASASLHQLPCIDRFVEVRGFSKEHIVEFIQSEFVSNQEKAGRLLEQFEYNPMVESVCSVPLNCAIVCHLWRTLEEALPTTMTELYTKIILLLILRNIRKIDTYSSLLSLPNFDALPADLQQSWWLLCKFAFQALEKDQLVFSMEELETFFPEGLILSKRILCFGLLQSAESIGFGMSFHFLHLTFQEYLAALHLARQSPDKQLDFFQSHKSGNQFSLNQFTVVNKFFFGINHFVDDSINCFIHQIFECIADESWYDQDVMSLCHCAFEARCDLINDQLAQYLVSHPSYSLVLSEDRVVVNFGYPRTAHDCSAILHNIDNIQECDSVEINFANCGIRENQVKKFVDILANKKGKLQIVTLNLSGSRLTVSGLQVLESAARGDLLAKLEELDLSESLTIDADTNAAWFTTFVKALSSHCPRLRRLELSDNNLGDNGLITLINSLKVMLSDLALKGNDIHAFGVSRLADAICSGKLKFEDGMLHLGDNPVGLEGSVAIGRIIFSSSHCQLRCVQLHRCELAIAGGGLPNTSDSLNNIINAVTSEAVRDIGQHLCQLPQSITISALMLDGNTLTGEGIHILAGFIHLCPCITVISTKDCGITSDDLIWLLDRLTQFKRSFPNLFSKLESWSLQGNRIDDSGVSALIDHLPSLFPRLGCKGGIYLGFNTVSSDSEILWKLKEELTRRREVLSWRPEPVSSDSTESDTGTTADLSSPPPFIQSADQPEDYLESSSVTGSESDTSVDCQTPPSKGDFTSLADIKHHFVNLIKWEDESGVKRELRIYSKIAHKWRQIATRLGFEPGEIESVGKNYPFDDNDRVTAILRRWFENAKSLPNASRYPKSWQGLINLLEDAELGEVAEELKKALFSPQNSVRGNLT